MTYADLHCHTDLSVLDGEQTPAEVAAMAASLGIPAVACTDHGNAAVHVQHQAECDKAGIKPLLGMEAYFRPDRLARPPDTAGQRARLAALADGDGTIVTPEIRRLEAEVQAAKAAQKQLVNGDHLILIAQGNRGLHDLWAASSESFATGFYGRPRVDWELLERYGSDLIATTSCLGGVLSQDLLEGRVDEALDSLDRLRALFPGRLMLEVQPNEIPDQRRLNLMLQDIAREYRLPIVAASDAHYPSPAEEGLHRLWMACQAGKSKENYWNFSGMLSEDRARELLGYLDRDMLDAAFRNTLEIADRCTARVGGHVEPPVFTPGGTPDDDARALRQLCEAGWHQVPGTREYRDREDREFAMVARKGLAGCYLIVADLVSWCRSQGILVGPGRGSAAGSLMSHLTGITSVDPLRAGLMFERFLTEGRRELPDFDLDLPSSRRGQAQDYAIGKYGEEHVVRIGTVLRGGMKRSLAKLATVMAAILPDEAVGDMKVVSGLIEEAEAGTAGLGLPWDELVTDPQIARYAGRYPQLFEVAQALSGRVYAFGQHPAGLVISPGVPLAGRIPMRREEGGKGLMVTQWDFRSVEALGYMKVDMLTLRNLDSIARAVELIEARAGIALDLRGWEEEHLDPQVYDEIGTGQTLGMFQLETPLCSDYCERMKPGSISDLSDLTTIIRPGPRNSGAAEAYLRRRSGAEPVTYPHPLLEEHLKRSYGLMAYQEDILMACKIVAGYDDLEADGVRKMMGKKLTEKIEAAGEEFIRRCAERGHDEDQVRELWSAMAEFGKYAFGRAHAWCYSVLSYWTAWLMTHYPVEMTASILSTLKEMDRMAPFAVNARRRGISVLPPDVRFSGADFTCGPLSVTYGLKSVRGVGDAAVKAITRGQPYSSWDDFRSRSGARADVLRALVSAGALDAIIPSRRGIALLLQGARDGTATRCEHKDPAASGPGGLPCAYDWQAEAALQGERNAAVNAERMAAGKRALKLAVKGPPKRCTVACRQYSPPPSADPAAAAEYRASELYRQDREAYGTWMSPLPFAQLDRHGEGTRQQAREIALAASAARAGTFPIAGILAEWHPALTRAGTTMWWAAIDTEVSSLSMACFSPRRDDEPDVPGDLRRIRPGTLVLADAERRSYAVPGRGVRTGWRLAGITPIGD